MLTRMGARELDPPDWGPTRSFDQPAVMALVLGGLFLAGAT
jgi:hypothetical protein